MKRHLAVFAGLAFAGVIALAGGQGNSCSGDNAKSAPATPKHQSREEGNILETALAAGKFKTLCAAVRAAGLSEQLRAKGPITVFAPTDEAFAKLGTATIESLLLPENKEKLVAILTYHVVAGKVLSGDVRTMGVTTLNGQRVDLVSGKGGITVDGAQVVMADVTASNGVIHAIDTVLMPSEQTVVEVAMESAQFKTLCKLLKAAGLTDALSGPGPYTVFAPTDEAFAKVDRATLDSLLEPENKQKLKDVLKYHVLKARVYSDQAAKAGEAHTALGKEVRLTVRDESLRVNDAKVVKANIDAKNGVIHVIDEVLIPE